LAFIARTRRSASQLVATSRAFGDRNFSIGCVLSFALGDGTVRLGLSDAGVPSLRARTYALIEAKETEKPTVRGPYKKGGTQIVD
jgi:hypothetical protein